MASGSSARAGGRAEAARGAHPRAARRDRSLALRSGLRVLRRRDRRALTLVPKTGVEPLGGLQLVVLGSVPADGGHLEFRGLVEEVLAHGGSFRAQSGPRYGLVAAALGATSGLGQLR